MNFTEFQDWRATCLQQSPGVLDCGETNLYRSLSDRRVSPADIGEERLYRCDLSRLWLARFGWSEDRSRQALVSRGVRHALGLIFRQLATDSAKLWVPQDVYPVYLSVAEAHGLNPATYPTLPNLALPPLGCSADEVEQDEYLLICVPLKPLGRHLTPVECAHLLQWLRASPRRCLLLDCVYDLGAPLHESTRTLEATGQAVILHSLTKGWLWPETFGIALFPEDLQARFEMAFRNDSPSQAQLAQARACLSEAAQRPEEIASALKDRAERLVQRLPSAVLEAGVLPWDASTMDGRYMFVVDMPASTLLQAHGVLGIPASVFGSTGWQGSILTSLAGIFNASHTEHTHVA
jgi:aspartate/methionine/tyrosine aminotransferase